MINPKSIAERLKQGLPSISLPTLGQSVDVPVYVIHNSPDPENYFFIFDFEQFVEASRDGLFVRPRLKVWAGRDDFDRRLFARQFRQSFAAEFDAARAALEAGGAEATGWFSWSGLKELVSTGGASFVANVVLLVGISAGKMLWDILPFPKVLQRKSDAAKLDEAISRTQAKVDEALAKMDVTLHQELWTHAYRGTTPGRMTGMDRDAWPLPQYVRDHLGDGTSRSWW